MNKLLQDLALVKFVTICINKLRSSEINKMAVTAIPIKV